MVKEKSILETYFAECKKGKMGVMPYMEGQSKIKFVWTNGKGWGREAVLTMNKDGKKEAWKLYQDIEKLNKDKPKKKNGKTS